MEGPGHLYQLVPEVPYQNNKLHKRWLGDQWIAMPATRPHPSIGCQEYHCGNEELDQLPNFSLAKDCVTGIDGSLKPVVAGIAGPQHRGLRKKCSLHPPHVRTRGYMGKLWEAAPTLHCFGHGGELFQLGSPRFQPRKGCETIGLRVVIKLQPC